MSPDSQSPLDSMPEVKFCPDCYAEGRDPYLLPVATHFYIKRSPRYKGGYRISAYCREHENQRRQVNMKKQVAMLRQQEQATGETPPALAAMREAAKRSTRKRRMTETPEQRAAREARQKAYYALHRERSLANSQRWAKEHRERNAEKAKRWYRKNRTRILLERGVRPDKIRPYQPRTPSPPDPDSTPYSDPA